MKTVLCTLYDSFYLDKGLVLYDSLNNVSKDFILYVLCMDDKCFDVLKKINANSVVPIKLKDFENEELLEAKSNRSFGEYCWTLTPSLIKYVLEYYNEPICTYIDADMFFYRDPQILIDEMLQANKTVLITPHRFSPEKEKMSEKGLFCVEFNTFVKTQDSLEVLNEWRNNCLDNCSFDYNGQHFGDQKYLDVWPDKYPSTVHICMHPGAGIAPWNIAWYENRDSGNHMLYYKKDGIEIPAVFYHFQHIKYVTRQKIYTGVEADRPTVDYKLVDSYYSEYLKIIENKKQFLEKEYGIDYIMKEHPVLNDVEGWKARLKQIPLVVAIHKMLFPGKYRNEAYMIDLRDF